MWLLGFGALMSVDPWLWFEAHRIDATTTEICSNKRKGRLLSIMAARTAIVIGVPGIIISADIASSTVRYTTFPPPRDATSFGTVFPFPPTNTPTSVSPFPQHHQYAHL